MSLPRLVLQSKSNNSYHPLSFPFRSLLNFALKIRTGEQVDTEHGARQQPEDMQTDGSKFHQDTGSLHQTRDTRVTRRSWGNAGSQLGARLA